MASCSNKHPTLIFPVGRTVCWSRGQSCAAATSGPCQIACTEGAIYRGRRQGRSTDGIPRSGAKSAHHEPANGCSSRSAANDSNSGAAWRYPVVVVDPGMALPSATNAPPPLRGRVCSRCGRLLRGVGGYPGMRCGIPLRWSLRCVLRLRRLVHHRRWVLVAGPGRPPGPERLPRHVRR